MKAGIKSDHMAKTIVQTEIDHFSKDSDKWWDSKGPFAPLHKMNPVRLEYIKGQICQRFARDMTDLKALKDLSVLDVGCGGGLICEPMSRMGAEVTGLDADAQAIDVAVAHAAKEGLDVTYRNNAVEDISEQYDVVLALEIIEHVADPAYFVKTCLERVKPGGLIIFSTLNRTIKSFALGKVAAEYILRWVPTGTHNWKQFVTPAELSRAIRSHSVQPQDITGVVYDPLCDKFNLSKSDVSINYFLSAYINK